MPEIIINLNEDRDAYVVKEPEHIIHVNELDQVWSLLEESIKTAKDYEKPDSDFKRKHDTIMLAGVRGSGKTTFMLSLLHFISEGKKKFKFEKKNECKKDGNGVEVLNIFDPTLIEDRVHVFINIISLIKDCVDEKAKRSNCFKDTDSDDCRNYKEWEKSFKKLADGLPAINGVGHDEFSGEAWLDSEFIMNKGVGRAEAANHLERNFHVFVRKSLKFIDKTAFLLCFDDIDTSFKRGWPVLEVLHKYLTTPQFITILSGDAHLYSILIRDQQWENFGDRMLEMEARTKNERETFKETVTHLEEQYFLKLLKSERRVFLNSLYRKGQQEGEKNILVVSENGERTPLLECYQRMMKKFGVSSISQQFLYYRFLASTPLRTQKQLLYAYEIYSGIDSKNMEESIVDVFWTALAEKKVDVSGLRNVPHYTVPQIISYLVKNKNLVEGYTLSPIYSDHFINGAQFALGAIVAERIKTDRSQIIEFWIRVCLSRELAVLMDWNSQEKRKGPSVEDFVEYCAVSNLKTSRYVSRFATAYMRAYLGTAMVSDTKISYEKGSWHGTLPLYGFAGKAKKNLPDRMDSVFPTENFNRIMAYLPLSGATNHQGDSLPIFSFYNLLGVLGEIVYVATSAPNEEQTIREVAKTLLKNAQYRDYTLPSWGLAFSAGDVAHFHLEEGEDDQPEEMGKIPDDFLFELSTWARDKRNKLFVSPSVMGKIFTRFFYATNKMDEELSDVKTIGEWIHRMVVVFMHSVVVVEASEKLRNAGGMLDQRNPTNKDTIFINNLEKINKIKQKDNLRFSRWLLACPLFKVYMKPYFDVSATTKNAEGHFAAFTASLGEGTEENKLSRSPLFAQSYNTSLHTYNLNSELDKVTIRIYEPKNISQTPIIIKSKLPSFSVKSELCKIEFIKLCNKQKKKAGDIIEIIRSGQIIDFLREHLSSKYNKRSLNASAGTKIWELLENGKWVI